MVFNTIRLSEPLDLTEVISAFDTVSLDLGEVIFTLDTVSPLSHHLFKCEARPLLIRSFFCRSPTVLSVR